METNLPTIILPGYFGSAGEYAQLARDIEKAGFPASVVPIQWYGWLPTLGDRPMTPVLKLLKESIDRALERHAAGRVNLVGHSAGGWIARLLLGDKEYGRRTWNYRDRVASLITLGTPHLSKEKYTVKNMGFVNSTYPGAFYGDAVRYVCVAGKAVYGERGSFWQNFTYQSYELTIGRGDCWGDGITPVEAAHLEGATNLTLEGVFHSPRGGRYWYGSAEPLRAWMPYLI
ncbi:esterase/lipase family protein [Gloeobacter violaceus]|uniref:Glr0986 protein n=1 Tax=Gloeobacter violaceus (strain ATCC 29082 / PCC 7421) TaxID=251221 RepID=Q7NLY3_GLOVI|nr:alpha/beta fold hydrolase [Gloeobacter violaceus]BAC88927.1 glr0986 [Gloeobacter violaceus PCC 7421]